MSPESDTSALISKVAIENVESTVGIPNEPISVFFFLHPATTVDKQSKQKNRAPTERVGTLFFRNDNAFTKIDYWVI